MEMKIFDRRIDEEGIGGLRFMVYAEKRTDGLDWLSKLYLDTETKSLLLATKLP